MTRQVFPRAFVDGEKEHFEQRDKFENTLAETLPKLSMEERTNLMIELEEIARVRGLAPKDRAETLLKKAEQVNAKFDTLYPPKPPQFIFGATFAILFVGVSVYFDPKNILMAIFFAALGFLVGY